EDRLRLSGGPGGCRSVVGGGGQRQRQQQRQQEERRQQGFHAARLSASGPARKSRRGRRLDFPRRRKEQQMKWLSRYQDLAYALLRIVAGFLFLQHGLQKTFGLLGGKVATAPLM